MVLGESLVTHHCFPFLHFCPVACEVIYDDPTTSHFLWRGAYHRYCGAARCHHDHVADKNDVRLRARCAQYQF